MKHAAAMMNNRTNDDKENLRALPEKHYKGTGRKGVGKIKDNRDSRLSPSKKVCLKYGRK